MYTGYVQQSTNHNYFLVLIMLNQLREQLLFTFENCMFEQFAHKTSEDSIKCVFSLHTPSLPQPTKTLNHCAAVQKIKKGTNTFLLHFILVSWPASYACWAKPKIQSCPSPYINVITAVHLSRMPLTKVLHGDLPTSQIGYAPFLSITNTHSICECIMWPVT